jgi:hypothetical protein
MPHVVREAQRRLLVGVGACVWYSVELHTVVGKQIRLDVRVGWTLVYCNGEQIVTGWVHTRPLIVVVNTDPAAHVPVSVLRTHRRAEEKWKLDWQDSRVSATDHQNERTKEQRQTLRHDR